MLQHWLYRLLVPVLEHNELLLLCIAAYRARRLAFQKCLAYVQCMNASGC